MHFLQAINSDISVLIVYTKYKEINYVPRTLGILVLKYHMIFAT